jgi:osmotically-inducible protein OsmY
MKRRIKISLMAGVLSIVVLTASMVGCSVFHETQYGADRHLQNKVQDALTNDPLYKYPNVTVTSMRGQVQLSGFIQSESQRTEAVKTASSVPGVLGVTDNMVQNTNAPVVPE